MKSNVQNLIGNSQVIVDLKQEIDRVARSDAKVLISGEHLVPEAALEALAQQNIVFTVHGKASYEQQSAALRGAAAGPIQ